MTETAAVPFERRPLPDQLRFLARKLLDGTGTGPVAAMVALTLQVIADEQAGAASEALLSLAAELEAEANGHDGTWLALAYRQAAELARSRAHPSATSPATVSRAPGDNPGGTGLQNPAQPHEYLSTSCLHGEHGYCQSQTGTNGDTEWVKAPAVCKFCSAPCVCPCHGSGVRA